MELLEFGCEFLSGPIDIVRSLHNAFRRDIFQIDDAVFKIARGGGDLTVVLNRLHIMGEVLDYHARGEGQLFSPLLTTWLLLFLRLTSWIIVSLITWLVGWKHWGKTLILL